jgi:hypothetical protein
LQKTKAWQRLMSLVMVEPDDDAPARRRKPAGGQKKPSED